MLPTFKWSVQKKCVFISRYVKNRVTVGTNTIIDLGRVEIYNIYVIILKSPLKHFIKAWTRWQIPIFYQNIVEMTSLTKY